MTLQTFIRILRRRWATIAAIALVCVIAGTAFTLSATPQYQSSARLFVTTSPSDSSDVYQGALFSVQRVTSYADLVDSSQQLANSVISDLNLSLTAPELLSKVTTNVDPNTVVLSISVADSDPRLAQRIAQGYATSLTSLVRELETPPGQTVPPIKATIVDSATLPGSAVSPRPVRNLALSLIFGLVLGASAAFARELLDNTVKTIEDVEGSISTPLLGTVPYDSSVGKNPLPDLSGSHAPRSEAFRVLRTNLQFVDVDSDRKVFVVSSGVPEEGKTSTAVNLAASLSQSGHSTLLIDGDLRRPRAHSILSMDGAVGVTSVLIGRSTFEESIQHHESGLSFMASGPVPPNPSELLQSNAMAELLATARLAYEFVIIDAPPLLPVTDAALLATQSDGALLVIRYGKATKEHLAQAQARLEHVDARLVGAVLNMVPGRAFRGGYGYGYGYGYAPTTRSTAGSVPSN